MRNDSFLTQVRNRILARHWVSPDDREYNRSMPSTSFWGRWTQRILLAGNLLVGFLYLGSAYSPYISPTEHAVFSCLGLMFPLLLLLHSCFFVLWLLFRPRMLWLPALFLLLGWKTTTTCYSVGSQKEPEGKTLKLLTYNTHMRAFTGLDHPEKNEMLNYLKDSDADILCLQEFLPPTEKAARKVNRYLSNYPYHHHYRVVNGNGLALYTRYPILSVEPVRYKTRFANGSVLYRLQVGSDTLVVVNNHLETNQLSSHDKELYKDLLKGRKENSRSGSKHLLKKLAQAAVVRGPQADSVAQAIRRSGQKYVVACGDFNDSPVSYAHRAIGEGLDDAFAEAGWGLGTTYNQSYMYFRIDHILVSPTLRVVQCEVDRSIRLSDHYPMWCILEKNNEDE